VADDFKWLRALIREWSPGFYPLRSRVTLG
jgi:hypothetical protein